MKTIRFVHTADLHLDSPFLGLHHLPENLFKRLQESTFTAFERVVDAAIEHKVDFVLIAGDLFDGEDRSIKAQARLRRQLERLGSEGIFTFIIHGNHDHLSGDWIHLDMPDLVHIFHKKPEPVQITSKNGTTVHVYGFSYPKRHVYTKIIEEYVKRPGTDFHIAMLHGSEEGSAGGHEPYAPFTVRELLEKGMDYWALGHIHKRRTLHADPYVVYPGNTQGRHRKENGEKGCYVVNMVKNGPTELEFIETADVRWESIQIELDKKTDLTELYAICTSKMEAIAKKGQGVLCELKIIHSGRLSPRVLNVIENGEFTEMLQDEVFIDHEFVWPYRIYQEDRSAKRLSADDAFEKVLYEAARELESAHVFEEAVSELYSHTYSSRYLDALDDQERRQILLSAKELLMKQLAERD
ncbi:exonuclease SbcCD subunit D [Siminovitchia sediminis]|uniref:Exonuclease SbcCD subunit D n=1 Tax=Siminovitchia sediminis TaxID=1274353 RepID=A0ABW4KIZ8_9BACI